MNSDLKQELSSCWDGQPFGHNRHGPKSAGAVPLFKGELGPHLTQCGLDRGLHPYQVTSWSIQPIGYKTPMSQTDKQERQTDNGPVAYGAPFYKRSPKKRRVIMGLPRCLFATLHRGLGCVVKSLTRQNIRHEPAVRYATRSSSR